MNKAKTVLTYIALIFTSLSQAGCKANDSIYTIPFTLYDDIAVVKLKINGSDTLNFVFDSGTTTSLIDSITADRIGLISDDSQGLLLNNDYLEMPMATIKTIKTGNLVLVNRPVIIQKSFENYNRITGIPINGIIGMDIFNRYPTLLNFDKLQIQVGNAIDTTGYKELDVKMHNDLFYVDASIFMSKSDSLNNRFLFDTGDMTALSLAEPFWRKNDLLTKSKSYYSGINRSSSALTSPTYFGNFDGISLQNYRFGDIYLNLTSAKRGFFSNDSIAGTIGIDILKRFNIIINLRDEKLYIKPNSKFNDPYRINTTGLRARLNPDLSQCVVEAVLQYSPAEQSGIQVGDIIVSINGIPASTKNIPKIRQMLRSIPGTKLQITVNRNNEILQYSVNCNTFSDTKKATDNN